MHNLLHKKLKYSRVLIDLLRSLSIICCIVSYTIHEFQWTNETLFFIKIYLILVSKRGPLFVVSLRDRWRDIHSERGLLVLYLLPGARGSKRLHPLASRIVREASDRLHISCLTLILCTLSKFDRVVITWSPSGYTPVGLDCPDVLSSHCLLITMW